jgi:hypothetical protein
MAGVVMVTGVKLTHQNAKLSLERARHYVHEVVPGLDIGHEISGKVNADQANSGGLHHDGN